MPSCEWRSGSSSWGSRQCVCSITVPDNSTMQDGFGTLSGESNGGAQTQEQSQSQSNGDSGLPAAAKAGIAAAFIGGMLLGLLMALGISYWQRKRASCARGDTSDPVERMEGGASAAQIRETRQCKSVSILPHYRVLTVHLAGAVFPFVEAAGGVQTRRGEFRKEQRPNGETYRAPETPGGMDERATTVSGATSRPARSTPSVISAHPPPYVS